MSDPLPVRPAFEPRPATEWWSLDFRELPEVRFPPACLSLEKPMNPIDVLERKLLMAEEKARDDYRATIGSEDHSKSTYWRGYEDGLGMAHAMLKDARGDKDDDPPRPSFVETWLKAKAVVENLLVQLRPDLDAVALDQNSTALLARFSHAHLNVVAVDPASLGEQPVVVTRPKT